MYLLSRNIELPLYKGTMRLPGTKVQNIANSNNLLCCKAYIYLLQSEVIVAKDGLRAKWALRVLYFSLKERILKLRENR